MTETEIQSLRPGDSIIGAFGEWDDELPISEVLHKGEVTQILIRTSRALNQRYTVRPNGPEILGVKS